MTDVQSRFISGPDGLKLHLRDYGPRDSAALPVVCLPGLARTAEDFDKLARAIAGGQAGAPRRVVAIDYRGRGLSERDPDWKHYDLGVESADIQSLLAAVEIPEAIFVGTSRGGIHCMLLAAFRPTLLRAVVMNDIGPVLEPRGLARIRGYVGKLPAPKSWADAVAMFKQVSGAHFTALSDANWLDYARLTLQEKDGQIVSRYDPMLMKVLEGMDLEAPLPDLWPQFEALGHLPLLVIRGENSDLLSEATLAEMLRRHKGAQSLIVPGQGHAPLLLDAPSIARICDFIAAVPA
ncbi:MAG: Alpha/beta hydrolase [Hyphomicrobiales bacterium]|nr:Alpha/beta hydrolase [Hyphomicrobiales bacterium]